VTFRPEFEPPWIGRPHVTVVTLNRLAERDVGAIVDRVVGNKPLPANIRQDIIERSDGIPLFIEEMTKAVLEAESQGAAEQTIAAIPSPVRAVPASLHASLMARLDRLGPAKEVAQIGAAIGREFSHALLAAVARKQDNELQSALDRLIEAGLLFRQGMPPHARYLFKHALVQDAAYGTLLREPRRALHSRIVETMEGQFSDIAESEPELLARHCTEAGLIEKAAFLWGKSGQRSVERSALVEAVAQLTRALDQITTLPSTPALRRDEIKLQVALITPLIYVKGYAAPEVKAAAERAHLLIEQAKAIGEPLEDPLLLFSTLYFLWVPNLVAFNGDVIRELAAEILALAQRQGTTIPLMIGHRLMASSLLFTGDIAEGRANYDQAIALYDPVEHRPLATRLGQDVRVAILSFRALSLWLLGYPEAALADLAQAVKYAREIDQAATLMYALIHTTMFVLIPCGNYTSAEPALEEVIALADAKGAPFVKALAMLDQSWILNLTGKASEAIQMFSSWIGAYRATGATIYMPLHLSHLARAKAELGQLDEAWRYMGEAMVAIETTKESWFESEVNRIAGEITLISSESNTAKAQTYFMRALQIARQQQAKSLELRAAMSMARLWHDQGKQEQARDLLAPVYGWFTEGLDTRDLKDAKALLEQLASWEHNTDEQ
jgi:predicted ATPase